MIYKRKTYRIVPEKQDVFNKIFDEYLLPSSLKNGAALIGRWKTENGEEITEIWEYPSFEQYKEIEKRIKKDRVFNHAKPTVTDFENLFIEYNEEFLQSTGTYSVPKQIVSVSGYITNAQGNVLLVKTCWRDDTWELPGGGVEEGERLDQALHREIFEETGVKVHLLGVTGVYSNGSVISIVFRGDYLEGQLKTSPETKQVAFIELVESNIDEYVTRPKYKPRVLDAMKGYCAPYEAFKVRPYELINRLHQQ